MSNKPHNLNHKSAVALLLIVIIISAVALLMAYTSSILGLGELDLGYTAQKGAEAFSIADGCVEETFRRIYLDNTYGIDMGDIPLTVSNGSCIIQISDLGGNSRRVVVTGTAGEYNKKIQSDITVDGITININTWGEVTD